MPWLPGTLAAVAAASAMIRSPALSQITTDKGLVHSGAEYSGCAWSTYSRAPLVRMTFASPRSSSVSWVESAASRARTNPRAPRPGGRRGLVCVDDLRRGDHGVGARLTRYGDAVLGLGTHNPQHAHSCSG